MSSNASRLAAAAALLFWGAGASAADRTVAVLSSAGGAYLEAFSAFQAAYGTEVKHFDASRGKLVIPPGTRTIVTFGTKAAAQHYPPGAELVYCMAPGFFMDTEARTGKTIKISMRVSPERVLSWISRIQPSAKRLRIFWMSPGYASFPEDYGQAGGRMGLEVSVVRVRKAEELPGLLRASIGNVDAFWLPPDPLLVTAESLMIFRQFSWANNIPLYAATKGQAREGACAAVSISFAASGVAAARAVKALRAGDAVPHAVFPEDSELTLNAGAARKCGLELSPEILKEADYLFP